MSIAGGIALEAARIVDGTRQETHGPKERSFDMAAELWSAFLGYHVTPCDVAQCLALLKVARGKCGDPRHRDHYVDQAGYAALAGELARVASAAEREEDGNCLRCPYALNGRDQEPCASCSNNQRSV